MDDRGSELEFGEAIDDAEHLLIANEVSRVVRQLLLKLGWTDSDKSCLVAEHKSMTALAQSLQTVFKIKDQVAEVAEADNNHPSSTPDGNTMDKLHAASTVLQSAADEMLQPMDQMLTDEASKWDDSSEKIDDATTEDDISFVCPSAWPSMITHLPNLPPRDIVKQLSSIAQQGLLIAPNEKHKGIANKRTIFERLQASSSKTEHDPRTWGLDPVAFIPSLNCCGRVVTIFEQAGTHWLVAPQPDNEEERLRQIHRVATDTYKLNMQVVTPSSKCQIGTGAAWDIGTSAKGKPITNHIASDVHMLPGHNLLPVEMPTHTTDDSNLKTFLRNANKVFQLKLPLVSELRCWQTRGDFNRFYISSAS